MRRAGLTTILLLHARGSLAGSTRAIRSPPAGSTRTRPPAPPRPALGGYLRDLGWPHGGAIEIIQGEDMGMRSRLHAEIGPEPGGSIRVSGSARML